jgi:hypothetical protein
MRKVPKTKSSGLMQKIVTGNVFSLVALDFLGPLIRSNGYEYILVLTDNFSKFAVCKPVAKPNAKSAANFIFQDIICTFARIPDRILSDCAPSFLGKIVTHLNILMGIKQTKTSGYRPSTNSVTERFNGTLANCLSLYVNKKMNDWSKYVKAIQYAYNSSVHSSTKYAPVEIVFGVKPCLPPDINLKLSEIKSTPNEYALGLAKYIEDVKNNVFENLEKSLIKTKQRYDLKHIDRVYCTGDKVLYYNPTVYPGRGTNKLIKRFEGPFVVKRQCSPVLYQLDFKSTATKSNIVHVQRLKMFYDRDLLYKYIDSDEKHFIPKSILKQIRSKEKFCESSDFSSESSEDSSGLEKNMEGERRADMYEINDISSDDSSESSGNSYHSLSNSDTDVEPNYNVQDGLRRSQRVVRPPNRLNLYLATIFCIMCCSGVESLAIVEPLIWNKLNNPIISGLESVTAVIQYRSPCYLFNDLMIDEKATLELRNWCNEEFNNDFVKPLNSFCTNVGTKDSTKFALMREKRFIFLSAIALITVVSIVASIGFAANSVTESVTARNRMNALQEESDIALRNIRELRNNDITEKRILQEFNNVLENITSEVFVIKNDLQFVKNTAGKAMRAISLITTRLHYSKNLLLDIGRDFRNGILNPKLLDLFNYTVTCSNTCPEKYWTAKSCIHDQVRNMIKIKYDMKIINPDLHVMTVDSFDLINRVMKMGNKCYVILVILVLNR